MSMASTPGAVEFKPFDMPLGMQTPQSMSDDNMSENLEFADDEQDVEPQTNKRKGESSHRLIFEPPLTLDSGEPVTPGDNDEVFSDTSTSASGSRRSARYQISVELPSSRKRSKLATEKTTSADNLTLGSPIDKKPERSSSGLLMSDAIDEVSVQLL